MGELLGKETVSLANDDAHLGDGRELRNDPELKGAKTPSGERVDKVQGGTQAGVLNVLLLGAVKLAGGLLVGFYLVHPILGQCRVAASVIISK